MVKAAAREAWFFKNTAPNQKWDYKRSVFNDDFYRAAFQALPCPSRDCGGTLTLCGQCVNKDVPGNIQIGYISEAIWPIGPKTIRNYVVGITQHYVNWSREGGGGVIGYLARALTAPRGAVIADLLKAEEDEDLSAQMLGHLWRERGDAEMSAAGLCKLIAQRGSKTTLRPGVSEKAKKTCVPCGYVRLRPWSWPRKAK